MASKTLTPLSPLIVPVNDIPDPPLASTIATLGSLVADDGKGHLTGDDDDGTAVPPVNDVPLAEYGVVADLVKDLTTDALLIGFARSMETLLRDTVLEDHKAITHTFDAILVVMRHAIETLTTTSAETSAAHADIVAVQLRNAVAALQEKGITVLGYPYSATVQAVSPQGYAVALTIQKQGAGELTQALDGLTGWLQGQGYTGFPG